ncbi:hypothetical protein BG004_007393, partial [Podila humilis]
DMVLSAIDDIPLSTHIYHECKRLRIPVNIADVPPQCDFYFCSTHRDQSLQVAVSTSGKGPKLANLVRRHIADHLPNRVGDAIEQVGKLRVKLRKMAPGPEVGPKRMQWMSRVCEGWRMEDLATLDDQSMDMVLDGFKDDKVFSFEEIQKAKLSLLSSSAATTANQETVIEDNEDDAALESVPKKEGRLILVGAGPGDPELLTRKAARLLQEADLVVADRLIPMEVVDLAQGEVRIAPKKRTPVQSEAPERTVDGNDSRLSAPVTSDDIQDQLNEWCLQGLREGKTVVRLKQGDPFIFGRGAEEILFFQEHGFKSEVVPGVSSALSAPLSAHVPLTHRGIADQVVITTAQAKGGVLPSNFPVYDPKITVVVLMGVGKAQEISEKMQEPRLGWPADIPVVIVENAHCPNERAMDATLETLARVVSEKKAVPPSVFVIGLGKALAQRLVGKGAKVILGDIDKNDGLRLANELNYDKKQEVAYFVQCDVTKYDQQAELFAAAFKHFGGVDIIVNNAGIAENAPLWLDEKGIWKKVIDIDLSAVIEGTRLGIEALEKQNKPGVIVNTASLAGLYPQPLTPVYCAAKFGVVGLTRSFKDFKNGSIRVNAVAPSFADTKIIANIKDVVTSMGPLVAVDLVTDAFMLLIEDDQYSGDIARITPAYGVDVIGKSQKRPKSKL